MRTGNNKVKSMLKDKVVLDLGTGIKSAEYLIGCRPKKIFALTLDKTQVQAVKKAFPKQKNINYILTDATKDFRLNEKVDAITAGLFFSSLEGSRPGNTLSVLEKVKKVLKPGGPIIIEDFYWEKRFLKKEDELMMELEDIRNITHKLAGINYPNQFPENYIIDPLRVLGFKIISLKYKHEGRNKSENEQKFLDTQLNSIKKHSRGIENKEVRDALRNRAEKIHEKLSKSKISARHSYLYQIIAK